MKTRDKVGIVGSVIRHKKIVYIILAALIVIGAFVDPDTPQKDAGMIAILQHHLFYILDRLIFPCLVPDILPARNLCKDQQPQLIAPVQESMALRVVAGTHGVAAQFIFQDLCVQRLRAIRYRIAHIRPALMTVQAAQFDFLPIEIQAVCPEIHRAETKPHRLSLI